MSDMQAVIELNNVVKRYGDHVVTDQVDLTLNRGECLLLVGHNGAGKTTLMKLLLGLTRPDKGRVRVLGEDPASASSVSARAKLGFLPESVAFQQAMTGNEILNFYARLNRSGPDQCQQLLALVGLQQAANNRVQTYSKGMRQRLGLAQALLGDPQLLLLDEPTTGLDPTLRQHFYRIIGDRKDKGCTSLISSHALNAFEARVDRVAIMKQGKLVACDTLQALSQQAALPVTIKIKAAAGLSGLVAERLGSEAGVSQSSDQSLRIECLNGDKMTLLRRLGELGDSVEDVEIITPRLDEVYNHYMLDHEHGALQ